MTTEPGDPVVPAVREVVQLFEARADSLRFPDVDHEGLVALCSRVREQHAELQRAEAALDSAREALAHEQAVLHAMAARGLAYARIFAEGDAELGAELSDYALGRQEAAQRNARPRRPRHSKASAATKQERPNELPFETEAIAAEE